MTEINRGNQQRFPGMLCETIMGEFENPKPCKLDKHLESDLRMRNSAFRVAYPVQLHIVRSGSPVWVPNSTNAVRDADHINIFSSKFDASLYKNKYG